MWIKASGPLSDNVYQITTPASTHFLIGGECAAIVDTGVSGTSERLLEELKKYLGDPSELRYIFLTHAHFDHVGGIPALREYAPHVQVVAGRTTAEMLLKSEVREQMYEKNRVVAEAMNQPITIDRAAWCDAITVERVLGDGDLIDLGAEVEVKLVASPGHTADSVAYYVRSDAALAAGEAVGSFGGRDQQYACFLWNMNEYLKSLDRLASLEVRALSLSHAGALTGDMPAKFLVEARVAAERFAAGVRERIQTGELVDEITNALIVEWQSQNISPEGPFVDEQADTLRQMVRCVAELHSPSEDD